MIAKAKETAEVQILEIRTAVVAFSIVGTSPLIMHNFSEKAKQELLLPSRRKNQADKDGSLKHDPINEYCECFYRSRDDGAPTLFYLPPDMVHGAIKSAALDIKGVYKTEIGRWVSATGGCVLSLYGIPQLFMKMARNSDAGHTPDVRTRPIFPEWAIRLIMLDFKRDPLTEGAVLNLMSAAGVTVGLGDWRPQKGGSYGKFRLCNEDDPQFQRIVTEQGRGAQQAAYDDPAYYNDDTRDLMEWFNAELLRRDKEVPSESKKGAGSAKMLPGTVLTS